MLIPVGTDATVYYRAYCTFAIMGVNILLFFFVDPLADPEIWLIQFGTLRPLQWLTGAFSHAGIIHLAMNMLFLFWFGQIVEGRLGWWRFLVLYLGISIVWGMLVQLVMIGADEGGALGSSGVIYGLIVISLATERKAHISCLFVFFPVVQKFDVRLKSFALFYLGWNLFWAILAGFQMGTEVLHLLGALVGLGAVPLLRKALWILDPEHAQEELDEMDRLRSQVRTVSPHETPPEPDLPEEPLELETPESPPPAEPAPTEPPAPSPPKRKIEDLPPLELE